ncbi:phosphoglycerate kinase [Candidatus Woesearchaeota archaeon]|nr:phosphoglycerate kinase [Candidatus Woesearchaeota archaeon]
MMFTLKDFDFNNKLVLVRADFNVPIKDGKILDDKKIQATLPTIKYLAEKKARIVLMSHLGRPKGKIVEELRLEPIGKKLEELLGFNITILKECIGENTEKHTTKLAPGNIILLENLRFHKEEESDDESFARKLADLADIYVNDAFGVSHRENASVHKITEFLPSAAGLLMEKEITNLSKILNPEHPFMAVLGGAKVSDKIELINALLEKVDKILIAGAMMFTFLKAQGLEIGKSLVEDDKLELAKELLKNEKIVLPVDTAIANSKESTESQTVLVQDIPNDKIGLDIGPDTIKLFQTYLKDAKTVFWNGPLGLFENKEFAKGTEEIAKIISESKATSIIGGGETAAAAENYKFTHISTGGGASLEFIQKPLPGIKALESNYNKFKA